MIKQVQGQIGMLFESSMFFSYSGFFPSGCKQLIIRKGLIYKRACLFPMSWLDFLIEPELSVVGINSGILVKISHLWKKTEPLSGLGVLLPITPR
jgi:hypothetical protein